MSDSLFVPAGYMGDQSGQPVQGHENFPGLSVFRCIDDFGNTVCWFFSRDIDHSFLGKASTDNVPVQVAKTSFIRRRYPVTDTNMENTMATASFRSLIGFPSPGYPSSGRSGKFLRHPCLCLHIPSFQGLWCRLYVRLMSQREFVGKGPTCFSTGIHTITTVGTLGQTPAI